MGRPGFEAYAACVELPRLLEQAVPRPRSVGSLDGGALLALAAHCLMVHEGFVVLDLDAHSRTSMYNPPADWNAVGGGGGDLTAGGTPACGGGEQQRRKQWVFEYKYGSCGHFVMYCTLHDESGKMFIHARQADNEDNVQVLGLRLDRYVPQVRGHACWDEVLMDEELLYDMFLEYIVRPLVGFAALGLQLCAVAPEHELRFGHRPSPEAQGRDSAEDTTDVFYESMDEEEEEELLLPRRDAAICRHSSGLDPKLVYMLNQTPPSLMLPAVLVTSAAATTAVLWAWRR